MSGRTTEHARSESLWSGALRILWPLDSARNAIRALDGVRALAALSIVLFHLLLVTGFNRSPSGAAWFYLQTGVQLFFVLSGFLLFRPYAQALLLGRPWPSWRRFYTRRALRILPAYWVTLAIVAISVAHMWPPVWVNLLTHVLLIHDMFPLYNRDLDGPMWTLAVEWQFYLLLPWLAAVVAWVAGRAKMLWRVVAGVLVVVVAALGLRALDVRLMGTLPAHDTLFPSGGDAVRWWFTLITMGAQGKDFEVFGMGMLAAVFYVYLVEATRAGDRQRAAASAIALLIGLAAGGFALTHWTYTTFMFTPGAHLGPLSVGYPLVVGVSYSGLTLGILLGSPLLRAPFEWAPLRFIGLISFSLYLWHLMVLTATVPVFAPLPMWGRVICAFVVSYVSYQLVERTFLRRRIAMIEKRPAHGNIERDERLATAEAAQSAP